MKIAVTGAHRVGKTTLIEKLHESLPEYAYNAEAYHELEESGLAFSEIPSPEDYKVLLEHSIKQITTSDDNVILDRCPVDILAYFQAAGEFENINIQSLYSRVQEVMPEIDLLVFVPIEEPDLIGCPESEMPELRQKVNEILSGWVWDFNLNTIEVAGSPATRRNQVINQMSKIQMPPQG